MHRRASILLVATLFAATAKGDVSTEDGRWHSTAVPWNRALPTVEVALGYPGTYLPADNCPIELHVAPSEKSFDGFIGFRFAVKRLATRDVPVMSRAIIASGKPWEFRTTTQLLPPFMTAEEYRNPTNRAENRDFVVTWYDAAQHKIAEQNLGRPPWVGWRELHALRVVAPREQPATPSLLGHPPVFVSTADLPAEAQWYRGFSALVVPVELWLDLPLRIREVMFHSGTRIVFVGTPRAGQQLTELDRALLPVVFSNQPSQVAIPAVLRKGSSSLASRGSWRAVADASYAGSADSPYLVYGKASSFAAEESAVSEPFPSWPGLPERSWRRDRALPVVHGWVPLLAREFRAAFVIAAALAVSALVWLLARKNQLTASIGLSLAATAAILAFRSQIRRTEAINVTERRQWVASGIAIHRWGESVFGRSPLVAATLPADAARTWSSLNVGNRQTAEVRSTGTLANHGTVLIGAPWDSTGRVRERFEFAPQPLLKLVRADNDLLTFHRPASVAANFAEAIWFVDGQVHEATGMVPTTSRAITLRKGDQLPSFLPTWTWSEGVRQSDLPDNTARVWFVDRRAGHTTIQSLDAPIPGRPRPDGSAFRIYRSLESRTDGSASTMFVLPIRRFAGLQAVVAIRLSRDATLQSARISAANGSLDLLAPPAQLLPRTMPGERQYAFSYDRLTGISPPGDVLRLDISASGSTDPPSVTIFTRRPTR